jgi:hypothetical protein
MPAMPHASSDKQQALEYHLNRPLDRIALTTLRSHIASQMQIRIYLRVACPNQNLDRIDVTSAPAPGPGLKLVNTFSGKRFRA